MMIKFKVDHVWLDGPQIAIYAEVDGKWLPYGVTEHVDRIDVLFEEDPSPVDWPVDTYILLDDEDNTVYKFWSMN